MPLILKINSRLKITVFCMTLCLIWLSGAWMFEQRQLGLRAADLITKELKRSDDQAKGVAADLQRSLKIMRAFPVR